MEYDYKGIANEIIERGINLFGNYDDWVRGAMSLANIPDGKEIFHAISSMDSGYKYKDSEYKFSNALRTNTRISIGTFLQMAKDNGIDIAKYRTDNKDYRPMKQRIMKPTHQPTKPPQVQPSYISWDWVQRCASYNSTFVEFLCGVTDYETIKRLGDEYALGATQDKGVIFWQIDVNGKVRTGKIMHYDADTGHRVKNGDNTTNWVHSIMQKKGQINGFNLSQCLFGEHLLKIYPTKNVAVVESEKTAVIASAVYPEFLWLATGGKFAINAEKMKVLAGRNVILFPDTDTTGETYNYWKDKAKELTYCKCIVVSDVLERYATSAEHIKKIDIADWLCKELDEEPQQTRQIMTDQERILSDMIKENPAIGLLVEVFNLEIVA